MAEEASVDSVADSVDLERLMAPGSPLGSWLRSRTDTVQMKVNMIKSILDDSGDSFVQKAELFYKKRPQLLELVEEISSSYRSLAERYEHLTVKIRRRLPKNVQAQYGIEIDPSPAPSPHPSPRPPAGMLIRRAICSLAVEQQSQADLTQDPGRAHRPPTPKARPEMAESINLAGGSSFLAEATSPTLSPPPPDWSSGREIPLLQPVMGRTRTMTSRRSPLGSNDKVIEVTGETDPSDIECVPRAILFQDRGKIPGGVREIVKGLNNTIWRHAAAGTGDMAVKDKGVVMQDAEVDVRERGKDSSPGGQNGGMDEAFDAVLVNGNGAVAASEGERKEAVIVGGVALVNGVEGHDKGVISAEGSVGEAEGDCREGGAVLFDVVVSSEDDATEGEEGVDGVMEKAERDFSDREGSIRSSSSSSYTTTDNSEAGENAREESGEDEECVSTVSGASRSVPAAPTVVETVSLESESAQQCGAAHDNGIGDCATDLGVFEIGDDSVVLSSDDEMYDDRLTLEVEDKTGEVDVQEGDREDAGRVELVNWEEEVNHIVIEGGEEVLEEGMGADESVALQEYVSELKEQKLEVIRQLSLSLSIVIEEKDCLASELDRVRRLLLVQRELGRHGGSWVGNLLACGR